MNVHKADIENAYQLFFKDRIELGTQFKPASVPSPSSDGDPFWYGQQFDVCIATPYFLRPSGERNYVCANGETAELKSKCFGSWDVDDLTTPLLELDVVYDTDDLQKASADHIKLVGKFMHPSPAVSLDKAADRIAVQGDHVYAVLADNTDSYFSVTKRQDRDTSALFDEIIKNKAEGYGNPLTVVKSQYTDEPYYAHTRPRSLHVSSPCAANWLLSQCKFETRSAHKTWLPSNMELHINGCFKCGIDIDVLHAIILNPHIDFNCSLSNFHIQHDDFEIGEAIDAESALIKLLYYHLSKSRLVLGARKSSSTPKVPVSDPPFISASSGAAADTGSFTSGSSGPARSVHNMVNSSGVVLRGSITPTTTGTSVKGDLTIQSNAEDIAELRRTSRLRGSSGPAPPPQVCKILPIRFNGQKQYRMEYIAIKLLRHRTDKVCADWAMTVDQLGHEIKHTALKHPHHSQKFRWLNGRSAPAPGYSGHDIPCEASHAMNNLMAVRDKFRFIFISGGRYAPHLVMNDPDFRKAWPDVEWCFPDDTADQNCPTPPLPPLSGSSGLARGKIRKLIFDLPIPEMGNGLAKKEAIKYGCRHAGIMAVAGHGQKTLNARQVSALHGFELKADFEGFEGPFYKQLPVVGYHTTKGFNVPSMADGGLKVGGPRRNLKRHNLFSGLPQNQKFRSSTEDEAAMTAPFRIGYEYVQGVVFIRHGTYGKPSINKLSIRKPPKASQA